MRTTRASAGAAIALLLAVSAGRSSAADGPPTISAENAASVKQTSLSTGHKGAVFGLAFSPDGTRVASASIDQTVRVWDARDGKQAALLEGHKRQAVAVGFRADGVTLVSAGYEPSVRLWDWKAGKAIEEQTKNPADELQRVRVSNLFVTFSADGTTLASTGDGGYAVDLWSVEKRSASTLEAKNAGLNAHFGKMAFSADGRWLAVERNLGDDKSEIDLWDAKARAWATPLPSPEKASFVGEGIAVSAEGSAVACVDIHSSVIHVWDAKTGKRGPPLAGHGHDADSEQMLIGGLAFSPDGRLLASASYDKTVRLWDAASGKQLASLATHGPGATAVVFSPDGRRLASANLDGTVECWAVPGG